MERHAEFGVAFSLGGQGEGHVWRREGHAPGSGPASLPRLVP